MIPKKTVIVTGGSRGIGAEIVKKLANEDYQVVLNYYQSKEKAEEICKSINEIYKDSNKVRAYYSEIKWRI